MQESFVIALGGRPNLTARSTTGTTLPRRLVTPRIQDGVFGTAVTVVYSMISFTLSRSKAYSSPAVKKVRYCFALAATGFASFTACIVGSLVCSEPREVVLFLTGRVVRRRRRHVFR